MSKISPCLWFDGQAEEAARFYTSLLPNSRIDTVVKSTVDWPAGKAGDTILVEFTLAGASYQALNGGPGHPFTQAISLSISCDDQAEVDRLWDVLVSGGGREVQCGWLTDRYGLPWQIVPKAMEDMLKSPDRAAAARAMTAMLEMVKLDVAALQRAFDGQ